MTVAPSLAVNYIEHRLEEVRSVLGDIPIPGSELSLVGSALVRNIRVIEDDVYVRLFHGSDQGHLVDVTRTALSSLAWTNRVVIDTRTIPGVKRTIAVGSGKGGVGKTSVTAGLASKIRDQGFSVGILDADVYGPNISTVFGADSLAVETQDIDGVTNFIPPVLDGIRVMSVGMLAEDGQSLAWRGPILTRLLKQFLFDVAWGDLDFLLIDLPPGTGDAQITLLQECPLAGVLLVGVPGLSSGADLRRTIAMYGQFDLPILGYVENFSSVHCPNCGHSFDFLLDQIPVGCDHHHEIEPTIRLSIEPELLTNRGNKAKSLTLDLIHPISFDALFMTCFSLLS